jgi:hypothetical protein
MEKAMSDSHGEVIKREDPYHTGERSDAKSRNGYGHLPEESHGGVDSACNLTKLSAATGLRADKTYQIGVGNPLENDVERSPKEEVGDSEPL